MGNGIRHLYVAFEITISRLNSIPSLNIVENETSVSKWKLMLTSKHLLV